jgi:hypothetical protein
VNPPAMASAPSAAPSSVPVTYLSAPRTTLQAYVSPLQTVLRI